MKAVILVGGEGTRLRPLTYDLPKPMVPIVNKPFMEHMVEWLASYGFTDIVFALGYKSDALKTHFSGERFRHEVEAFPLGTAGPIKNVAHLLDDTFVVLNGDVLCDIDLGRVLDLHRRHKAIGTIALTPVEDTSAYGVVETDAEHRVQAFIEKPPPGTTRSDCINAGIYILEPSVLDYIEGGRAVSIEREVFPALVRDGKNLCALRCDEYWLDIGSPQRYLQANQDMLLGRMRARLPVPGTHRQWLGVDVQVAPDAVLNGPCWIGDGCRIEAGAVIEGPVVLGRGCVVGASAEVRGAVVWDGSVIGSRARLDRCILGRGCTVGDGAHVGAEAVLGSGQTLARDARMESGEKVPA